MRRRQFITLLGGAAAAWPLPARAQQPARPVVGILYAGSPTDNPQGLEAVRQGLAETGFTDGRNIKIEYRWAGGHYDMLPGLAADLVGMQVTVLATTGGDVAAQIGKTAAAAIPMVFAVGGDPVQLGLVASLDKPGGNITGASWFTGALAAKRMGLLRDIIPNATMIAMLVNPDNARTAFETNDAQQAARVFGWDLLIANASAEHDFEQAFATFEQHNAAGLLVVGDAFFFSKRAQLSALAAHHAIPAIYSLPEFARAGGLMSYGSSIVEANRQVGIYIGRILKGEKPADLPVVLPTRYQLVINLKTAKSLRLTLPSGVLAIADEVIE